MTTRRPEVLAPARDHECLRAAIRAGADAVYFGLTAWNARARATNFAMESLADTFAELHASGVRGYVTMNTLVFDHELRDLERALVAIDRAGADAIIVQDLGVAELARRLCPDLPLHASTQMTCTDAASVRFARSLGCSRVVVARELSIEEIAAIRAAVDVELEVFVHGALCIAYSGQCLTSEAIGGRSANRGACAQACRLPYSLVVDGAERALGEHAYLLSPSDLEASSQVGALAAAGVRSLKIEGRLKDAEYVAATTRLYRHAVDAIADETRDAAEATRDLTPLRDDALQTYTRGATTGFLTGIDHQRLVEGRGCDHRGLVVGAASEIDVVRGRPWIAATLSEPLVRGDGVLVEGGWAGEGELGGRIWAIETRDGRGGYSDVERAPVGASVRLWLGPEKSLDARRLAGRRLFRTHAPEVERRVRDATESAPHRVSLDLTLRARIGAPLVLEATSERGHHAKVTSEAPVVEGKKHGIDEARLREQLARLGDTPFTLGALTLDVDARAFVPVSLLNQLRRDATAALVTSLPRPAVEPARDVPRDALEGRPTPRGGLYVLVRNEEQALAAIEAGADGVYLDYLELVGLGKTFRSLRASGAPFIGVAPPRIRKPSEEKIDDYLFDLGPDAVLVRGLGLLEELAVRRGASETPPSFVGDFSLNLTNSESVRRALSLGLDAFTPSFDLDATQLSTLLETPLGRFAELVVHHPMPLFHMEHCVFAALLSTGRDHKTCGRPCEKHEISLRDRAGMEHPVQADVGCRNTVFHGHAQSAAGQLLRARAAGVVRTRVELVRETAADTRTIVATYRALLAGEVDADTVWKTLRTERGYGVVRGSLRVLSDARPAS